jgi:hypothetical protein
MKNNRPSNTILNAVLLLLALFAIYLFGNFIVALLKNSKEIGEDELSISPQKVITIRTSFVQGEKPGIFKIPGFW